MRILGHGEVAVDRKHIQQVIDYLWRDEEKDYDESDPHHKEHIFLSLRHLQRQLDRQP